MKQNSSAPQPGEHLSVYGTGPLYVAVILLATVILLVLDTAGAVPHREIPGAAPVLRAICAVLIVLGAILWYRAAITAKLGQNVQANRLITTGVYAWVRNPIYTAFFFLACGLILWNGNLYLFPAMVLHWAFLTLLMKHTEEKWLAELYGPPYLAYCQRVNRCFPWFPKRGRDAG